MVLVDVKENEVLYRSYLLLPFEGQQLESYTQKVFFPFQFYQTISNIAAFEDSQGQVLHESFNPNR